jgi:transcriptional regulator with XRE-family HTH domain
MLSPMESHLALKLERERQGKTAAAAAQFIGVSEDMVRRYDSGRSDISLRAAERYAQFLGKQLGDILPSSQLRSGDLQPFIMALQDFEPEERTAIIEKAARDLAFLSSVMSGRTLRHENRDSQPVASSNSGKTDVPALPVR